MSNNTVVLNENLAPWIFDENPAVSGETDIKPGHAVEITSSTEVQKKTNEPDIGTDAIGRGIIAVVSRSDPTLSKSDKYNADDDQEQVHYAYVPVGGKFDGFVAAGGDLDNSSLANVSEGDLLHEADLGALAKVRKLTASTTQDVSSISAQTTNTFTISVSGAKTGMPVSVSPPSGINTSLVTTAYVTSSDTVTVAVTNPTSGSIDPSSGTYKVEVHNQTEYEDGALYRAEEGNDNSSASAGVSNQSRLEVRRIN